MTVHQKFNLPPPWHIPQPDIRIVCVRYKSVLRQTNVLRARVIPGADYYSPAASLES
jgi:hypothetical protein